MAILRLSLAGWTALMLALAVRGNVRGTMAEQPPTMVERPPAMVDGPGGITRAALLEQALGLQQNGEFEAAVNMYIALLKVGTDCCTYVWHTFGHQFVGDLLRRLAESDIQTSPGW